MDREETRTASSTLSPRSDCGGSWGTTRLPILCARPGNVGVQIDAYRSMKSMFNRPRCGQFTAHFLGFTFENSSMDNHQRIIERTAQRAKLVEAKLAKLHEYEQHLIDDEQKRKTRRVEREAARQRRLWQEMQAMKRRDQRVREDKAAVVIQRHTRGMMGRQVTAALRRQNTELCASQVLYRSLQRYVYRCRRHRRIATATRQAAALVLQRQARSFVCKRNFFQRQSSPPAMTTAEGDEHLGEVASTLAAIIASVEAFELDVEMLAVSSVYPLASPTLMARDISLDLLFSDDDDDELGASLPATLTAAAFAPKPPPPSSSQRAPQRPVRVKRVGGGFRQAPSPPQRRPKPISVLNVSIAN